ncbi:hypothetical protein LSAT2_005063 [Lamellibrachia satsuma]|nr:hypothetical protein LSAT2_005063 [Lamellibrachia satsuma]
MDTDSGGSSSPEREVKDIENEECCMDSLSTWSSGNTPSAASGKDDLMMIIRGTETQENQDIDQVKGHYHGFTSALAEQEHCWTLFNYNMLPPDE